ncbi:MAG: cytochrome P450, partial [Ilumatobacteraceae bacterium]
RYDDVLAFAHDAATFTSQQILVTPPVADGTNMPYSEVSAPPISSDPPEHHGARRLILPVFAPQSVAKFEDGTRDLCHRLIDGFIDTGRADAAADYAQQIPVRVIATMLGVGTDRSDEFTSWVRGVLEVGLRDPKVRIANRTKILEFFFEQVADRRANPREDDLITEFTRAEIDGEPVSDTHIVGTCNLMLVAGIDTTWSAIGSSLWHLAQHPEHRTQLRDRPEIWPMAIEELLRAYSPVTMARMASKDTDVAGCPIREGDRVLMTFPAANRDPDVFENPDEVILDREHNRHIAFGAGIHRCAGSNLARLELRVALQTWLERIPDFELDDPGTVTWAGGQVRGPRRCRVTFPAM